MTSLYQKTPVLTTVPKARIESIDVLRGLIMVVMALDHTRDFFHAGAMTDDPLNLATTTPALFMTRWITHFCAPTFALLSGTSIYLQGLRKSRNELSVFLLKRGLWLIVAEVLLISPADTFTLFNPINAGGVLVAGHQHGLHGGPDVVAVPGHFGHRVSGCAGT